MAEGFAEKARLQADPTPTELVSMSQQLRGTKVSTMERVFQRILLGLPAAPHLLLAVAMTLVVSTLWGSEMITPAVEFGTLMGIPEMTVPKWITNIGVLGIVAGILVNTWRAGKIIWKAASTPREQIDQMIIERNMKIQFVLQLLEARRQAAKAKRAQKSAAA